MKAIRIIALILAICAILPLAACEKENGEVTQTSENPGNAVTEPPAAPPFTLLSEGKTDWMFICSEYMLEDVGKALSSLYSNFKTANPSAAAKLKMDYTAVNEKEIIVGKTKREGSDEFHDSIPEGTFVIEVSEKTVRIGGYTSDRLRDGIEYFAENYMTPDEKGDIVLPAGRYVSEVYIGSFKDLLNKTDKFVTKTEKVKDVQAIDGRRIMQGGCTDGKYLYMAMINSGHSIGQQEFCYIHKIDMQTMETVKISEAIPADHSNDLTYVPATNEIYINHCYEKPNFDTVIDADTLEIKRVADFNFSHNSISYNEKKDVFILATRTQFRIVDRLTGEKPDGFLSYYVSGAPAYTSQGSGCDDDFIYFVFYNNNCLRVHDWTGAFVTEIEIDIKNEEPENISIVGDQIYIGCNNSKWSGGTIYKGTIVKK